MEQEVEAGGGGAGAGIGGNGGKGGCGNAYACTGRITPYDSGQNGEAGENCGDINIYNSVKVIAYGGAGGSGGMSKSSAGGGGGGYPAAGIGGGGAGGGGGDHISGGGGYTGGNQEYVQTTRSYNGMAGKDASSTPTNAGGAGSGYFQKANNMWSNREIAGPIGGGGMYTTNDRWSFSCSGDGGVAGKGGCIVVSNNASIEAHNGNKYTDGSDNHEDCTIYIQDGRLLEIKTSLGFWDNTKNQYYSNLFGTTVNYTTTWGSASGNNTVANLRSASTIEKLNYTVSGTKYYVGQGIGSGAGYIELSNGTYTVDSALN